ncbi:MAG: SDR family oxidoreductase [Desulfuromonadaceae bacterium]|nr:SDR family oxidoreductase [Desulfuromonas sp.]MDY0185192.1 SDR family oxidoreductase [Desulfuromonadaceae bacterium]
MEIKDAIVLVSGANGGIGTALVEELLAQGAAKVYVATRDIDEGQRLCQRTAVQHGVGRVQALQLDITSDASVAAAVRECADVNVLINNAGVNLRTDFLAQAGPENARIEIEVNYFGTLVMCRAFAPVLARNAGSSPALLVNVASILGKVNLPIIGTYSASKAAQHSLTQGLRAQLSNQNIRVIGVYPGPVDTRMTAGDDSPKAQPQEVARAIILGLSGGEDELFPDRMAQELQAALLQNPKQVEKNLGASVA